MEFPVWDINPDRFAPWALMGATGVMFAAYNIGASGASGDTYPAQALANGLKVMRCPTYEINAYPTRTFPAGQPTADGANPNMPYAIAADEPDYHGIPVDYMQTTVNMLAASGSPVYVNLTGYSIASASDLPSGMDNWMGPNGLNNVSRWGGDAYSFDNISTNQYMYWSKQNHTWNFTVPTWGAILYQLRTKWPKSAGKQYVSWLSIVPYTEAGVWPDADTVRLMAFDMFINGTDDIGIFSIKTWGDPDYQDGLPDVSLAVKQELRSVIANIKAIDAMMVGPRILLQCAETATATGSFGTWTPATFKDPLANQVQGPFQALKGKDRQGRDILVIQNILRSPASYGNIPFTSAEVKVLRDGVNIYPVV